MALSPLPSRRTLELIRDESVRALQAAERATRERFNEARLFASLAAGLALVGFLLVAQWRGYEVASRTPEVRSDRDLAIVAQEMSGELSAMRAEIAELDARLLKARTDAAGRRELLAKAETELEQLDAVSGMAEATGPGVVVAIDDPEGVVMPEDMLALLSDLRAAGAEAMAVNRQRVAGSSWFSGESGRLALGGEMLSAPYAVEAIGDAGALRQAVDMPGGIGDRLEAYPGVRVSVMEKRDVRLAAGGTRPFGSGRPRSGSNGL